MVTRTAAMLFKYLPSNIVKFLSKRIVDYIVNKYAEIQVSGKENLENIKRPVIYVCNHLSNSDGLILNKVLQDERITFVAGIKLSDNPVTNIGINAVKTIIIRPNTADKDALSKVVKAVKEGNNILIFPEGTRSRTGSLIEAKKGVLLIARLTKVPIIPLGIWGTEKLLSINKAGEMGSEYFRHAKVNVKIGKQFSIPEKQQGEERHQYEERSLGYLMKAIAELIPEEYRGVYK
jgi:1-acyl-sn-glycerol-3-phosphate acyltransferase